MIAGISNSLSQHTLMAIHATGDLKKFQIFEGGCLLTILPIAWILLKYFHISPEAVILVYVIVEVLTQFVRVYLVYPKIGLQIKLFYTEILVPSLLTLLLCAIPAYLIYRYAYPNNFLSFTLLTILLVISECIIIGLFGLDKTERNIIMNKIKSVKCQR